jgi:hypothetical protein
MLKKLLSLLLVGLCLTIPGLGTISARTPNKQQPATIEQIKLEVAKLGTGAKARATVTLKNGAKVKGYMYRAGEDDFTLRNRKTDEPTTIRYSDVAKVRPDKGHSFARNLGLGIGIGAGAFLAVILIVFATLDD